MTHALIRDWVTDPERFEWLSQMKFYFEPNQSNVQQQLTISMANANFFYGFVQTPLTDRLYLTMTQALKERLWGFTIWPGWTQEKLSLLKLGRFVYVYKHVYVMSVLPAR